MTPEERSALIARNLEYWDDAGQAAVRRDSEIADEVAGHHLQGEEKSAEFARFRRACANAAGTAVDPDAYEVAPVSLAHIDEMAEYSAAGLYAKPAAAREISAEDRAFAFSAEGEFAALCKERTGDFIKCPKDETKRSRQAAQVLAQSKQIADKMISAGFPAYRETGFELVRYYVHSRQVEKLPAFRRTCFLPYVAQSIRAPMVSALEFWLSKNAYPRFWTFSSGPRVLLEEVRGRVRWMHKRLKELNAQPFMQACGARMVFRSTELGTPEMDAAGNERDGGAIERDEMGRVRFHVHAHVVVEMAKGWQTPETWSALLSKVGKFWGFWWGEGGAIRNARECCKYVTKPGEMLKLSGPELVALHEQLTRLKLVQPMGALAEEIKEREAAGKRLVKRATPEGRVYLAVNNWNRHGRKTKNEAAQDAAGKLTPKTARGAVRVVARGTPRFGESGVAEPVATVMFMHGSWNEGSVRSHALIAPVIRATVHEYFAGVALRAADRASGISVHTRTPTVAGFESAKPRPDAGRRLSGGINRELREKAGILS
jgi:hypothetical protein